MDDYLEDFIQCESCGLGGSIDDFNADIFDSGYGCTCPECDHQFFWEDE